jgi:hypothetical protein
MRTPSGLRAEVITSSFRMCAAAAIQKETSTLFVTKDATERRRLRGCVTIQHPMGA